MRPIDKPSKSADSLPPIPRDLRQAWRRRDRHNARAVIEEQLGELEAELDEMAAEEAALFPDEDDWYEGDPSDSYYVYDEDPFWDDYEREPSEWAT